MGCIVTIPAEFTLPNGKEIILTWQTQSDPQNQHTKKEYLKVYQDKQYKVSYEIRWRHNDNTTQPLQVTIYKVSKEYELITLHQHVTVCVGNPITLKKDFSFSFNAGERICVGAKNLSTKDFMLISCNLSLTEL